MESPNTSEFATLRILFYALLSGVLLFAAVVVFLLQSQPGDVQYVMGEREDLYALAAYALAMIAMSRFMDKTRRKSASIIRRGGGNLFGHYRTTMIVRLALLEGAAFMILALTLVTRNTALLYLFLPLLLFFWTARPRLEELTDEYGVKGR